MPQDIPLSAIAGARANEINERYVLPVLPEETNVEIKLPILLFIVPNLHCAREAGFKDGIRHYKLANARVWWPSLGEPSWRSLPTPTLVYVDSSTAPSMWNHQDVRKLGTYEENLALMRQRWGRDTIWIEP